MTIPILSVIIGLVLVVVLIIVNMRMMASSSAGKRSERQYPVKQEEAAKAETPKAEPAAARPDGESPDEPPRQERAEEPKAVEDRNRTVPAEAEETVAADREAPVEPSPAFPGASDQAKDTELLRKARAREPEAGSPMGDDDYRRALLKFRQPGEVPAEEKRERGEMKDEDYRSALKSMMDKGRK
ncbi:hypothetical protein LJK88_09540 [Paenibacillus sp. P26]|nr:hypothetical protein LJK88_09540 [Paenibacillus sp. P26]UUZ89885.1 hypothetical protein LJK87_28080 [Paenibacillus sp. P25]